MAKGFYKKSSKGSDACSLEYIPAGPTDAGLLSETAFNSKKVWNYTDEQMELWTEELTITETYIAGNKVFRIYNNKKYIGFFSLVLKEETLEIDHLWLIPETIRKGYGRAIFKYIKTYAGQMKVSTLEVYAEPHAKGFYEKMGGHVIRKTESKIKGRYLEVYEFKILF